MTPHLPTKGEMKEIRANERETVNRLYLANYEFILTVCKSYCRNAQLRNTLYEDMAQECFLYFSKMKFESVPAFIRSIRDVCVYVRWGGERVYHQVRQGNTEILTILDEPTGEHRHGGECAALGETLESDFDIVEAVEPPAVYADTVYKIATEFLTPRQKEAFYFFYYTDMTAREIGKLIGVAINGASSLKHGYIASLRKNIGAFMRRLSEAGVPVNR